MYIGLMLSQAESDRESERERAETEECLSQSAFTVHCGNGMRLVFDGAFGGNAVFLFYACSFVHKCIRNWVMVNQNV